MKLQMLQLFLTGVIHNPYCKSMNLPCIISIIREAVVICRTAQRKYMVLKDNKQNHLKLPSVQMLKNDSFKETVHQYFKENKIDVVMKGILRFQLGHQITSPNKLKCIFTANAHQQSSHLYEFKTLSELQKHQCLPQNDLLLLTQAQQLSTCLSLQFYRQTIRQQKWRGVADNHYVNW